MYIPTTEDIRLLYSHNISLYCKIELLNSDMKTIDTLDGVTTDGNLSSDAESDVRNTYSGSIIIDNALSISKYPTSEWMSKYVRIYIGEKGPTGDILWYPKGIYVFSQNGFKYNEISKELSISCVDLVSKLNGDLGGQLTGLQTKIVAGVDIGKTIIETLQLIGFTKCDIDYWNRTVPYDLVYDTGSTVWKILTELRDLYYPFEMYFNGDTFTCKEIPSGNEDQIVLRSEIFDDLVISEDSTVDYTQVHNCVEVFGGSVTLDITADSVSGNATAITVNVTNANLSDGKKIAFECQITNSDKMTITVINTIDGGSTETVGPFILYKSETDTSGNHVPIKNGMLLAGKYYVIQYYKSLKCFYFIGQMQPHAMCMLMDKSVTGSELSTFRETENCDNLKVICTSDPAQYDEFQQSRFSIEKIGRRNLILSGSEYENYTTDEGVMSICQYMLWKNARLTDSVTVEMIMVPWLEVNQKVSYHPHYLGSKTEAQFLIKKIDMSLGSRKMSVTMTRFYPYYPYIVDGKIKYAYLQDSTGANLYDSDGYRIMVEDLS